MFGEQVLDGEKILKVNNGIIKLPEFTNAELNENLYYLLLKDEIRLYSLDEINNFTTSLLKYMKENYSYKDFLKIQRTLFAKMISEEKVKNGNKIKIPKHFLNLISNDKSIIFVGANNHAKIFTNINQYDNYKKIKKYN